MSTRFLAAASIAMFLAGSIQSQHIVAQLSGLPNPTGVIDFGANLYPNLTPITNQFSGITVSHARYFTNNYNNLVGGFLTNDFSGLPNTVSVVFARPITDLSFVYHQISTSAPSTIRALLAGVTVTSFSGTWNQTQPNNYFGFTNIYFDELQIDFVADFNIDTLAYRDQAAGCILRNGTGINPTDFTCASLPVLGTTWQGQMVTNASTILTILGYAPNGLAAPSPLFGGELLLQTTPPPIAIFGFGSYSMAIPSASAWIGTAVVFQGFRAEVTATGTALVPLNALELVLGL
ncbi:MAG: hypothetical protein KDC98_16000 [Planctomycetes bacterium]|nr:hypothetical protein [Planctomycetota bacterium]